MSGCCKLENGRRSSSDLSRVRASMTLCRTSLALLPRSGSECDLQAVATADSSYEDLKDKKMSWPTSSRFDRRF